MSIAVLIVAAGVGRRAGGELPKQFALIGGIPVVARAIDAFPDRPVVVVIAPGQQAMLATAIGARRVAAVVEGGAERHDSVRAGLDAVAAIGGVTHVLIHDAARPFCPPDVVTRLVRALETGDAVVPVLPVADTIARGGDALGETVDRNGLWRVQTPQGFRLTAIRDAHARWTGASPTDDAQVARAAGIAVATVAGDHRLDKLTTAEDFGRMDTLLPRRTRTAMGFDVHRLAPGLPLWLGGVAIAHDHGLVGHSDADVILHALTDAILGAIGAGDIGTHFPPSDPQWAGAASAQFLDHAVDLVAKAGGRIEHVDVTVMAEAPKIGPHRAAIVARIAELCRIDTADVSVKATTTEGLGFTGRREGIATHAVATVTLPERGIR